MPYAVVRLHPLDVGEEATYESLEEAVAAFGIDAPIVPKEIPEGFELVETRVVNQETGILIYATYKSTDGDLQIRYRETAAREFSALEKENGVVNSHFMSGIEHRLISDMGWQKAVWRNGDFECMIAGAISEQEIMDMVDSIYRE